MGELHSAVGSMSSWRAVECLVGLLSGTSGGRTKSLLDELRSASLPLLRINPYCGACRVTAPNFSLCCWACDCCVMSSASSMVCSSCVSPLGSGRGGRGVHGLNYCQLQCFQPLVELACVDTGGQTATGVMPLWSPVALLASWAGGLCAIMAGVALLWAPPTETREFDGWA